MRENCLINYLLIRRGDVCETRFSLIFIFILSLLTCGTDGGSVVVHRFRIKTADDFEIWKTTKKKIVLLFKRMEKFSKETPLWASSHHPPPSRPLCFDDESQAKKKNKKKEKKKKVQSAAATAEFWCEKQDKIPEILFYFCFFVFFLFWFFWTRVFLTFLIFFLSTPFLRVTRFQFFFFSFNSRATIRFEKKFFLS